MYKNPTTLLLPLRRAGQLVSAHKKWETMISPNLFPCQLILINFSEDVTGSRYSGDVFIGLKEGVFEPSSHHIGT